MLFLQPPADANAPAAPAPIPIADDTGLAFERALLAGNAAERLREVSAALSADSGAAAWALGAAESRLGRTINRIEDAAAWLAQSLEAELAVALKADLGDDALASDVSCRLPRLVARLSDARKSEAEFQRRLEYEKLESLKELAYGASHEINNPLANIAARAQTLLEDESDPERQRKLTAIHRQAMRAHEMISDLMLFARPPKLNPTRRDIAALARKVVEECGELAEAAAVDLAFDAGEGELVALADETQLAVAIGALVKNAIEAAGEGGHVRVTATRQTVDGRNWAEIAIADTGPGISEEVRRHMFDPFYSGREAGRGLGFGASKCWRIVTDHGGQVDVRNRAGGGAEVIIRLALNPPSR
jgi:signal transduction histidine kinase